nr:6227_t:CDS:2 [Entrophospora candida]CAG8436544.1 878_t:CDS:2 [Entrophospora candida]
MATTTTDIDDKTNQHNFAEHNRDHFNENAESYDKHPYIDLIVTKCANAILERVGDKFDEEKTEVMEFACGTGLLSQKLCSHVKSILGVDISQSMVDVYNRKAWQQGIPKEEMEAICLELSEGDQLNGKKFDFIICASSYHHIDDVSTITKLLSTYLKPGDGQLIVLDLKKDLHSKKLHERKHGQGNHVHNDVNHKGHEDNVNNVVAHKGGFDPDELKQVFVETGLLKDVEVEVAFRFEDKDCTLEYLIARGKRGFPLD